MSCVVAVQPCMGWTPIKKIKNKKNCWNRFVVQTVGLFVFSQQPGPNTAQILPLRATSTLGFFANFQWNMLGDSNNIKIFN